MRIDIEVLRRPHYRIIGTLIGLALLAGLMAEAFTHTLVVLGILAVACLGVALIRFPIAALVVVLFLEPFHSAIIVAMANKAGLPFGPLRHWEDVLIALLFVRAVVERLLKDRKLPLGNAGDNLVLAYIGAFILLAVASPSRPTVGDALVLYTTGPMLFLTLRFLRPTRKQLWACILSFVFAATVVGTAAIFEKLGPHEGFLRWYGVPASQVAYSASQHPYRSASFLIDTLILAFYLAGTASFTAGLVAIRSRWRPAALYAFVACAGGLVATITRSGYIGGAVGMTLVLLLIVRNPMSRLALVGMTLVLVGGLSIHYVQNGTLTRGEGDTAHKHALQRDLDLLAARPLGYGIGSTDRFRFQAGAKETQQLGATESTYMARALEGGVPSLILYLVTLYVLILRLRSMRMRARRVGDVVGASLAAGAMGAIVGVALSGLFLGVLERPVELVLWGAPALALAWSAHREAAPGGEPALAVQQAGA
jgi:hypothetical protein